MTSTLSHDVADALPPLVAIPDPPTLDDSPLPDVVTTFAFCDFITCIFSSQLARAWLHDVVDPPSIHR